MMKQMLRLIALPLLTFLIGGAAGFLAAERNDVDVPAPYLPAAHEEAATQPIIPAETAAPSQKPRARDEHDQSAPPSAKPSEEAPTPEAATQPASENVSAHNMREPDRFVDAIRIPESAPGEHHYQVLVLDQSGVPIHGVELTVSVWPEWTEADWEDHSYERRQDSDGDDPLREQLRHSFAERLTQLSNRQRRSYTVVSDQSGEAVVHSAFEGTLSLNHAHKQGYLIDRASLQDGVLRIVMQQATRVEFVLDGNDLQSLSEIKLEWELDLDYGSERYHTLPASAQRATLDISESAQAGLLAGTYRVTVTAITPLFKSAKRIEVFASSRIQVPEPSAAGDLHRVRLNVHLPAWVEVSLKHPEGWSFEASVDCYRLLEDGALQRANQYTQYVSTGDSKWFRVKQSGNYRFTLSGIYADSFSRDVELAAGINELAIELPASDFERCVQVYTSFGGEPYSGEVTFYWELLDQHGSQNFEECMSARSVAEGHWEVISLWRNGRQPGRVALHCYYEDNGSPSVELETEPLAPLSVDVEKSIEVDVEILCDEDLLGHEADVDFYGAGGDARGWARMERETLPDGRCRWKEKGVKVPPGMYTAHIQGSSLSGTVIVRDIQIARSTAHCALSIPALEVLEVTLPQHSVLSTLYIQQHLGGDWLYQTGERSFDSDTIQFARLPHGKYRLLVEYKDGDTPIYIPFEVSGPLSLQIPELVE